jgi:hypothetical protein
MKLSKPYKHDIDRFLLKKQRESVPLTIRLTNRESLAAGHTVK